jgi:hypothetical protein
MRSGCVRRSVHYSTMTAAFHLGHYLEAVMGVL